MTLGVGEPSPQIVGILECAPQFGAEAADGGGGVGGVSGDGVVSRDHPEFRSFAIDQSPSRKVACQHLSAHPGIGRARQAQISAGCSTIRLPHALPTEESRTRPPGSTTFRERP